MRWRRLEKTPDELSVRQELQADCYSGVWAYSVFADCDAFSADDL